MLSTLFPSSTDGITLVSHISAQPLSYAIAVAVLVVTFYAYIHQNVHPKSLPLFNAPGFFSATQAKKRFADSPLKMLAEAQSACGDKPYRIMTDLDEFIVLPPSFTDEIRNIDDLDFFGAVAEDFHTYLAPFKPLSLGARKDQVLQSIVRKDITRSLGDATLPLSNEAAFALPIIYGDGYTWHEVGARDTILSLVARLSSRLFLGEELCRNEDWLRVTKSYTVVSFMGSASLNPYTKGMRYILQWFFPFCKETRKLRETARREIIPVIEARRKLRKAAAAAGKPSPVFNDALDWVDVQAGNSIDAADFQLVLSVAAIHTTSSLLTQTMLRIVEHSDIIEPLREEIAQVLREHGWKKTSLYSLKLLDSVLKETQRHSLRSPLAMRRLVKKDIRLSNGLLLRKGARVVVDSARMVDPQVYENPQEWIGDRYLKLRSQPGGEHTSQLVSTSVNHISFGHGQHACPGRFFASNEMKIAMCHLLMKYDWKLAPGSDPNSKTVGLIVNVNGAAKLLVRRREDMELDIDCIS